MNEWWTCLSVRTRMLVNLAKNLPKNPNKGVSAIWSLRDSCASESEIICSMAILLTEAPEHVAVAAGHALFGLLSDDSIATSTAVSEYLDDGSNRNDLIDALRGFLTEPPVENRQVYIEMILGVLGDDPIGRNKRIALDNRVRDQAFFSIVRISGIGGTLAHSALREIFEQSKDNMLRFNAAAYLLRHNDAIGVSFIEEFGQTDPRMRGLKWAIDLATCGNEDIIKVANRVVASVHDLDVARKLLEFSERLIEHNASYAVHLVPLQIKLRSILNPNGSGTTVDNSPTSE